ncbi:serine/threonine protein phosphatase [bacterium]|jgi:diadenosine tetraphosphatase ApaH/serine/threonine PP2A family protein phosphatase|nr:serine/threonine protein phosphatase [Candidatus Elulimicrobium humile]
MVKRTIIVGDIHGCLDEFRTLVDRVGYRQGEDRLICAGDLVDRGPDSAGVVRYAMNIGAEAIRGNHDAKLLRRRGHMMRSAINPQYRNPMHPDPDQEHTISQLSDMEVAWLSGLSYYIELPEFNTVVVHAGFLPGRSLIKQSPETMTMVRYVHPVEYRMMPLIVPGFRKPEGSVFWAEIWDGTQDVIFGHTVVGREWIKHWNAPSGARCYGIDTGCVFGGRLSAMILDMNMPHGREVVQINATREHSHYGSE